MEKKFTPSNFKKVLAIGLMMAIAQNVFTYSSGPPTGNTNAPGDGDCSSCHSMGSPITSGSVWSGITLTRSGGLTSVAPNSANAMTLSFTSTTSTLFGFQLVVLPNSATSSSASVGTFTVGTNSDIQTVPSTSPTRTYLEHTYGGGAASSGSKSWAFNWQTPSNFSGGATFYVAINEADGDNSSSGDNIYLKTFSTTVLPVRWLDFSLNEVNGGIRLNWSTAQEINNNYFEVERSTDGKKFESIGRVKGGGTVQTKSYYGFEDLSPLPVKTIYRIKQVDMDGKEDYSTVLSHDPGKLAEPRIVVNGGLQSLWFDNSGGIKNVRVYGLDGNLVQSYASVEGNSLTFDGLQNGIYLIEVNGTGGDQWLKKLLVQ